MKKNILIGTLLGLAAYLGWDNVKRAVSNRIGAQNIRIGNITGGGLGVELELTNKNLFPLPVDRFEGDILLGNESLGKLMLNNPLVITPNETELVQLQINTSGKTITESLSTIIRSIPSGIFIDGTAYAGLLSYDIRVPVLSIGGSV